MTISSIRFPSALSFAFIAAYFLFASPTPSVAQVVIAPATPQIGSPQPATADPTVPRPHTRPCIVPLFTNEEFANFTNKIFSYTPPSACPAPWGKVVFTADFTVTAGRQFDRTAAFYLGHANLYYGTTAEPSSTVSPSWHVERNVTDLSPIFKTPQSGEAVLGNFIGTSGGVLYNGIIYADAALEFYPPSIFEPAPPTPDLIIPLPDAAGGAATLNTTANQLAQPVTLPTNVERVFLDVISQSQSNDEFWYTCAPTDVANEVESCPNTAFRETEISIDDQPAGVAPIYPWIYTGGIDPYLWRPIPGVQTFDFVPYRVDLTPFAGLLSDGQQHTVALSLFNADYYFLVTANLLVYTDHGSKTVTGGILSNNLPAAPSPVVTENLNNTDGKITGTVTVTSTRDYAITGYVNTSHGRIETTVAQIIEFRNAQTYDISANGATYIENLQQSTTANNHTTARNGPVTQETLQSFSYPLILDYASLTNPDGSATQTTTVKRVDSVSRNEILNAFPIFDSNLLNQISSTDTLNINASGALTGTSNRDSSQLYFTNNSLGYCYSREITSAAGLLTAVNDGQACRHQ